MKNLSKVTEPFLTQEAIDIVNNIKVNDVISTSDENYTIREITEKTLKCTSTTMMEWCSKRIVIRKDKLQDLLEDGFAEIF